jgi:hypothetical protein
MGHIVAYGELFVLITSKPADRGTYPREAGYGKVVRWPDGCFQRDGIGLFRLKMSYKNSACQPIRKMVGYGSNPCERALEKCSKKVWKTR